MYALLAIIKGAGDEVVAGMLLTLFVFSLLPACLSLKSKIIEEPNLMSYFSGKVPGSGLCSGFALLRNSKKIDDYALQNRLKSMGSMVSDDDLFAGKTISWGSPGEALILVQHLLASNEDYITECRRDLEELKPRLEYAVQNNLQFCFIIRTARGTNAMEWEQRKGHC
jgi:hypothetical protein